MLKRYYSGAKRGILAREKKQLLAVKGVSETVRLRPEQMDISTLKQLASCDIDDILAKGVVITGSTCWDNSPQARKAIQAAIDWAQGQ
ncbi:MAG: recombinase RecA [Gammaproteobacteria bacterium]|nr:MAG: recombinase RecA [Gammaproteobacteria bacterium]